MGLRFDINLANWIAYLLDSNAKVPPLPSSVDNEYELVDGLLDKLSAGFRSSPRRRKEFDQKILRARNILDKYQRNSHRIIRPVLSEIREDLSDRAWTALIMPTWLHRDLDRFLCSYELLEELVAPRQGEDLSNEFSGLVLQLQPEELYESVFPLIDVFPLFQVALNNAHQWPGLLVWTNQGQSNFFPIASEALRNQEKIAWYLRALIEELNEKANLGRPGMPILPDREEPEGSRYSNRVVHIIQASDVHLGTKEADSRLPQLQTWIRQLCNELKQTGLVIPIVTGDLMNTNDKACVSRARLFMDFLSNLGTESPKVLSGNHDVRADGIGREDFKAAVNLFADPPNVYWYDDHKLGLVCFNSALGGDLARGKITEEQRVYLSSLVARKQNWQDYLLVAALHHHPLKMEFPAWYVRPFYEKIFGRWFGITDKLVDAEEFVDFVENHNMGLVIHGHKHIPKIAETPEKRIPVFACGSSVGKVKRRNRKAYLSLNVLTIDTHQRQVTGRLLAQPVGGGVDLIEGMADWIVGLLPRIGHGLPLLPRAEPHEQQLIYRRIVQ